MAALKLIALDADDLTVISAHLQDAVGRVGEFAYLGREKRFVALFNRFDWERAALAEKAPASAARSYSRQRCALRFERVLSAKVQGFSLEKKREVLSLLAIQFTPGGQGGPEGDVTLTFAGGAAIKLQVECLECELRDIGPSWRATARPDHPEHD